MKYDSSHLDAYLLEKYFERWKQYVATKDDKPFVSFSESPFLRKEEGYKDDIEREANRVLSYDSWKQKDVGTGKILEAVIESMRFSKSTIVNNNNLIFTSSHSYTSISLPYRRIQELFDKKDFKSEQLFYDFFKSKISDAEAFGELVQVNGRKFSVPAYLLFVKNKRQYVPIAPVRFEKNLTTLGSHIALSKRCEWGVYQEFLAHVSFVRDFLAERIDEEVRLLDAHSFLWMVDRVQQDSTLQRMTAVSGVEVRRVTIDSQTHMHYQPNSGHSSNAFTQESLDARQTKNKASGARGELIVYEAEKDRLTREGQVELASQVAMVSDNVSLGYDILSYNLDGSERHIEVKTTQQGTPESLTFFISSHELQRAVNDPQFRLCFVLQNDNTSPVVLYLDESLNAEALHKILEPCDPLGGVLFVPKSYMVKIALKTRD